MTTTSLQHCSNLSPGFGNNEVKDPVSETMFSAETPVDEAVGVGAAAMKSLCDDVESLCLVKECHELESAYGTRFTDDLFTDANCVSQRIIKRNIREMDRHILVQKCSIKSPYIAGVVNGGWSWPKLCESALHLGSRHTSGLHNLSRLMDHHGRGQCPCPLCDLKDPQIPIIEHFLREHNRDIRINFDSTDHLLSLLSGTDVCFVYKFWNLFKYCSQVNLFPFWFVCCYCIVFHVVLP